MERYFLPDAQKTFLESMIVPLAVYQFVDHRVVTLALSEGFCRLFGYEDRSVAYDDMNHNMYKDTYPSDVARIADAAYRFATEGGTYQVIYRSRIKDTDGYKVIHAVGEHVFTPEGVRLAYVWYLDEGEYQEGAEKDGFPSAFEGILREDSLPRNNQYDFLTGLPTMTYFFQLAEGTRDAFLAQGEQPVLLYMDFCGMKYFNMKNGFAEGDKLLRAFASLLQETFHNENCCRMGSDHFCVICGENGVEERLTAFLERCREIHGGSNLPIHVGIYPHRMGPVPASVACDRAKFACDALKNTYGSGFSYYNQNLRDDADLRQHVLSTFSLALERGWVKAYYQPIVRAVSGQVCDEEALARWDDPELGFLNPGQFIPALEDAGLMYKLDLYVLEQVLKKMQRLEQAGIYVVPHSINLSRTDFNACDIVEEVRSRVDEAGIQRDRITIELTESVLGTDFEFMKEQVARFQSLGFPVWMDDFGSGYSSLDLLQSIRFDLIKFDMSFMRKLNEDSNAKILLTELMKLASSLGADTVCEGVETEQQVRFLQEIGCSKLQGYFFSKPHSLEQFMERRQAGRGIDYENPAEAPYFQAIGRVNLYDLAVIANEDSANFHNIFNTLPMSIVELQEGNIRFVRSNRSYREFMSRFFDFDLSTTGREFSDSHFGAGSVFMNNVKTCCKTGEKVFFDEQMADGSVVHAFARKIAANPVTGTVAVAVAVLTISDGDQGATYAQIARALAADYYNFYYVDLRTDRFIEYTSSVGGEELAVERHGERFFDAVQRDAGARIYEEDRDGFLSSFTKEKVVLELDRQGVYTATYRLIDTGVPMYVNMKITRIPGDNDKIILGVSIIDSQMKQSKREEEIKREQDTLMRVMALNDEYYTLYSVDPDTGGYIECTSSDEYCALGFNKTGEDFFTQGVIDGRRVVFPEDLPHYLQDFKKGTILESIRKQGFFRLDYRLVIGREVRPVCLKIIPFQENGTRKLLATVRAIGERR